MSHDNDAWAQAQRQRLMHPNAHLWIRPDAYRFMAPDAPQLLGKDAVGYFWPEAAPACRLPERKYSPDQPRVPAGNAEGGQWASPETDVQESTDVQSILDLAPRLAAANTSMSKCLDICSPLLERFQPPGSDRNQFDFRKCLNACLGRNR